MLLRRRYAMIQLVMTVVMKLWLCRSQGAQARNQAGRPQAQMPSK